MALLWAVTGPGTMSTQLQNPHLMCFVAYSGPSPSTQLHTYWLLLDGQADTAAAEGPMKRKALEGSGQRLHLLHGGHNCSGIPIYGHTSRRSVMK